MDNRLSRATGILSDAIQLVRKEAALSEPVKTRILMAVAAQLEVAMVAIKGLNDDG